LNSYLCYSKLKLKLALRFVYIKLDFKLIVLIFSISSSLFYLPAYLLVSALIFLLKFIDFLHIVQYLKLVWIILWTISSKRHRWFVVISIFDFWIDQNKMKSFIQRYHYLSISFLFWGCIICYENTIFKVFTVIIFSYLNSQSLIIIDWPLNVSFIFLRNSDYICSCNLDVELNNFIVTIILKF